MSKQIDFLTQTCIACPSQWEARLQDGSSIYVRYRHGGFRATHGETLDHAIRGDGEDIVGDQLIENSSQDECNRDGFMTEALLVKILEANGFSFC